MSKHFEATANTQTRLRGLLIAAALPLLAAAVLLWAAHGEAAFAGVVLAAIAGCF